MYTQCHLLKYLSKTTNTIKPNRVLYVTMNLLMVVHLVADYLNKQIKYWWGQLWFGYRELETGGRIWQASRKGKYEFKRVIHRFV